ncbi:branched-chain amino acid aminotransferase [Flavobacteriaceae bacterium]|nr:branched-chain amino acid aminotransferase [Flavobacteriaceae bacterium]MDC1060757.1 branched-chain amino acid aminotransferase [Flavobacteriaceae bacterium]
MKIKRAQTSKIHGIDFNNLSFGQTFTDHMFVCDYIDGAWVDPRIIPYQPIQMDPSSSVLHYGQAVFEGMKAYKDDNDRVWLFRPEDNHARINKSAVRLAMPEFPKDLFMNGMNELVSMDSDWIKPGVGNSLYVRPFIFANQAGVSASASNRYSFMIICAPVGTYYSGEINVLVSEKFSRAASGGVGYAKAAGNYAAAFYPTQLAQKEGYQQIIWTDANTHEYLEESGTMNVFFRIDDTLITAPTTDTILDGITRKSVIQIAKDAGISVEVRPVKVTEVIEAHKVGRLKEIFGAGTAVVVSPISGIGFQGQKHVLPTIENSYAAMLKEKIVNIQYNKGEDPYQWRKEVVALSV